MCGIACILKVRQQSAELRRKALEMSRKIRHRGPDWSGIWCGGSAILAHERLSIVDPESGGQPLLSPDGRQVLAVNGEIYNHQEIRRRYAGKYDFCTGSDCEVILALYRDKGPDFLDELNGIFAFVLYDEEKVHRVRCRRNHLRSIGTESPGRPVRALRTLPARPPLLERRPRHEAVVPARVEGFRCREGQSGRCKTAA